MKLEQCLARGRCYVIAEAGSNHDGRLEQAFRLIDVAAEAGADAVKFQLFSADRLYVRSAGKSDYLKSSESIFDIIKKMEMPLDWLPKIAENCAAAGVEFLASAFDEAAIDAVDPLVPAHKCASYELTHHPLLAKMASKRKPLLLSTGTASLDEVVEAAGVARAAGAKELILLQCTASYPAPLDQANVRAMTTMREAVGCRVGLSDHTREPSVAAAAAVALGAAAIEKHFTLSNRLPGPDHPFAVEPDELAAMVTAIRDTERALGTGEKKPLPAEKELRAFARRSIFTLRAVRQGERLDEKNIAVLRCGTVPAGLPPSAWTRVLGKTAKRDIAAETAITEGDLG
jgi:N-acetylneuraminate synthase